MDIPSLVAYANTEFKSKGRGYVYVNCLNHTICYLPITNMTSETIKKHCDTYIPILSGVISSTYINPADGYPVTMCMVAYVSNFQA